MECGLTEVPAARRALTKLQHLDLGGNALKALPRWRAALALEALHVSDNPLPAKELAFAVSLTPARPGIDQRADRAATATQAKPTSIAVPPSGVIAPHQRAPDSASA